MLKCILFTVLELQSTHRKDDQRTWEIRSIIPIFVFFLMAKRCGKRNLGVLHQSPKEKKKSLSKDDQISLTSFIKFLSIFETFRNIIHTSDINNKSYFGNLHPP